MLPWSLSNYGLNRLKQEVASYQSRRIPIFSKKTLFYVLCVTPETRTLFYTLCTVSTVIRSALTSSHGKIVSSACFSSYGLWKRLCSPVISGVALCSKGCYKCSLNLTISLQRLLVRLFRFTMERRTISKANLWWTQSCDAFRILTIIQKKNPSQSDGYPFLRAIS